MYDAAPLSSEQIGAAQEVNARLRCNGATDFNEWLVEYAHAPLSVSAATTESHLIVAAEDEQPCDPFRSVTCWRNPMT
jgi:hypothetical protein